MKISATEHAMITAANSYLAQLGSKQINDLRNEIKTQLKLQSNNADGNTLASDMANDIARDTLGKWKHNSNVDSTNRSYGIFRYIVDPKANLTHKNDYDAVKFAIGKSAQEVYATKLGLDVSELNDNQKESANKTYKADPKIQGRTLYDAFRAIIQSLLMPENWQGKSFIPGNNSYQIKEYKNVSDIKKDIDYLESQLEPKTKVTLDPKKVNAYETGLKVLNDRYNKVKALESKKAYLEIQQDLMTTTDKNKLAKDLNDKAIKSNKKIHRSLNLPYLKQELSKSNDENKITKIKNQLTVVENSLAELSDKISLVNKQIREELTPEKNFSISSLMSRVARVNNFACTGRWFCPECGKEMKNRTFCKCGYSCK